MGRTVHYFDHKIPHLGRIDGLTPRRAQVLEMVAQGLSTEDIALKLGISEDTVCSHVDQLRNQFSALNRVELIAQACAHGVLSFDGARYSLTKKAFLGNSLDYYGSRATAKARRRRPLTRHRSEELLVNDIDVFDAPAYLRQRLNTSDTENALRLAHFTKRTVSAINSEARRMNTQSMEINKVLNLALYIHENFATEADAVIDWEHRRMVITVDQGGKTVFAATVEIDSPALEAKLRLVRHDLEKLVHDALAERGERVA